jgi:hypothetical protein
MSSINDEATIAVSGQVHQAQAVESKLSITFLAGAYQNQTFDFSTSTGMRFILGRPNHYINFPTSSGASRNHATIYYEDAQWLIVDLGSQTGTWKSLNTYPNIKANIPSEAMEILNGMQISIAEQLFNCEISN